MPKSLRMKLDLRNSSDFRLTTPVRRKYVVAGTDAVYTVRSEALTGYTDDVDLSVSGLPTGASATIGYDPIGSDGQTDITVETTGTAAGTYNFLIGGTVYTPPEDIYYAESPALADVQAAIDAAGTGDTVIVPAGSATWSGSLQITKGICLIGAGIGVTNITGTFSASESNAYVGGYQIGYKPSSPSLNTPFRFSGFTVNFGTGSAGFGIFNDYPLLPIDKIRIDHCAMSKAGNGGDMIISQGHIYGVVDNNTLTGGYFMFRAFGNDGASWTNQTFTLGTGNNLYYEDNNIICSTSYLFIEGGAGGRYCVRHNDITFAVATYFQVFDIHGNTAASHASTMGAEIYENTINIPNSVDGGQLFDHRGGRAVIFNNDVVTPGSSLGANPREEALDSDGPGPAFSPDGQSQHVSGSYYFSNKKNGTDMATSAYAFNGQVNYGGSIGLVPQWDIDCWRHTTPFTGASGVGIGLLSARPSSGLVAGVGYWATDTNTLYRATGATTWETYYTPYTYPHPHRSDPVLGD